jgi:hypothetical protein
MPSPWEIYDAPMIKPPVIRGKTFLTNRPDMARLHNGRVPEIVPGTI